jgi:F-type H+-transporting ATPase subunit b
VPQLDLSYFPTQIFWLLLIFSLLYFVLSKWGLPKVGEILEDRQAHIESHLEKARSLQQEVDSVLNDYEAKLNEARQKAQNLLRETYQAATLNSEKKYKTLEERLRGQLSRAENKIAEKKAAVLEEMPQVAFNLSQDILKHLGIDLKKETNIEPMMAQLIEKYKNYV